MSENTNARNNKKYCSYHNREVVVSSFNNDGKCGCLKCNRAKCKPECKSVKNEYDRVVASFSFQNACWCSECLNNTIYSEQQR